MFFHSAVVGFLGHILNERAVALAKIRVVRERPRSSSASLLITNAAMTTMKSTATPNLEPQSLELVLPYYSQHPVLCHVPPRSADARYNS